MSRLATLVGAQFNLLDQCRYGQKAQKATTVAAFGANYLTTEAKVLLGLRCTHRRHEATLSGQNAGGAFK
eukprot:11060948-Heterocapsa_arctica.AAC.1